jgi:hypothetical protein
VIQSTAGKNVIEVGQISGATTPVVNNNPAGQNILNYDGNRNDNVRRTFVARGGNFNAANTDMVMPISLPTGYTQYMVAAVRIAGASGSLTAATAGVFAAGGVAELRLLPGDLRSPSQPISATLLTTR